MNQTKNILLYWLIIFFIFNSCSKISKVKVSGQAIDETTNVGVAGATIYLIKQDKENNIGGELVAETTTDSNGNFKFEFKSNSGYNYYATAQKNQYIDDGSSRADISIKFIGKSKPIIKMKPYGYLTLHLIKISQSYEVLHIGYKAYGGFGLLDTLVLHDTYIYGNKINNIGWFVNQTNYQDEIYCPAFDTTIYEIKF
jgi:hypothetical protein